MSVRSGACNCGHNCEALTDGLSDPSKSTVSSSRRPAASHTARTSGAPPAPGATSAALDDACKHDEDRLAELRANPSVDAAIRFDNELKCPRLEPQLPAVLDQLTHAAGSVEAANGKASAPNTPSANDPPAPASSPPASEATPRRSVTLASTTRTASGNSRPSLLPTKRCVSQMNYSVPGCSRSCSLFWTALANRRHRRRRPARTDLHPTIHQLAKRRRRPLRRQRRKQHLRPPMAPASWSVFAVPPS